MDTTLPFLLSPDCQIVKGHRRSAVYDLTRNEIKFIPNGLADILTEYNRKTIAEVFQDFQAEDHELLQSYFDFLQTHEYIILCDPDELDFFPSVPNTWKYPAKISNAILFFSSNSSYDFLQSIQELELLGCKHIEIRIYEPTDLALLKTTLEQLEFSPLKSIALILQYSPDCNIDSILELIRSCPRVISALIFAAPFEQEYPRKKIKFVQAKLTEIPDHKNLKCFNVNMQLFYEAQSFNAYYNRKVCIDQHGAIKNTPESQEIFGRIGEDPLSEVIEKSDFQKLWTISKDKIDICKACEFRYMCVDPSPVKAKEDGTGYSVGTCNYDPFTASWAEEDNNPTED